MFLRNTWYVAGWASEFTGACPAARTVINEPVVLYRTRNGSLVALEDRCAHRLAPLSLGRLEGDDLRCMYHGVKFSAAGQCVEVPGQENPAKRLCVRKYPVVERHRWVWIWMGDPQLANPDLIPDASMLDDSWRRLNVGQLDYQANHALISDNLLDLSHLAFLHEKTLGRRPESAPKDSPVLQMRTGAEAMPIERGVRTESWWVGEHNRSVIQPKNSPVGDVWTRVDFLVPGIFISRVAIYPPESAQACGGGVPGDDLAPLTDTMSCQAVTPMTARTTRYFYSSGPRASDMSEEESQHVWEIAEAAFLEDKFMIEAQQEVIDHSPDKRMGWIDADRGSSLFRALMERLIKAESSASDASTGSRIPSPDGVQLNTQRGNAGQ